MAGTVRVEEVGPGATIWIENPSKRNALDMPLLQDLAAAARRLQGEADLRFVVLRGAAGVFGAGADFDVMDVDDAGERQERWLEMERLLDDAVAALSGLPQPVVAAMEGPCFGGAVQLALCADVRLASETLRLAIPAASIGIVYPLDALARMVSLLGPARTKLIVMTGREFSATDAEAIGLVDATAPAEAFDGLIGKIVEPLTRHSSLALRGYKRIIDGLVRGEDLRDLRTEQDAINAHPDTQHALQAALSARRAKRAGSLQTGQRPPA